EELDEANRQMTMAGMPIHEDAAAARLRRYTSTHRRAFNKAFSELMRVRKEGIPMSSSLPRSADCFEPKPLSNAALDYFVERDVARVKFVPTSVMTVYEPPGELFPTVVESEPQSEVAETVKPEVESKADEAVSEPVAPAPTPAKARCRRARKEIARREREKA